MIENIFYDNNNIVENQSKDKKSIYINPMTESVFTSTINMSKKLKDNIKYLNLHAKYFKPEVKPMVNELVKLYSDRKITQISTVTNVMNSLASTEK